MKKLTKAIIPAAGLGTRFLPITKAIPKPMLPIVDKPSVQYIVEELSSMGITDIVIVVSPDSNIIQNHFSRNESLENRLLDDGKYQLYEIAMQTTRYNVHFVEQKVANGLAGAILCAEPFVGDEPFALLLGDEMIYSEPGKMTCIEQLAKVYEKTGKSVLGTIEVFGDDVSKYGNIGIKDEQDGIITVDRIVEKPSVNEALSNNAIIGRYVLSGQVMSMLKKLKPRNNEIYLTDVLDELASKGELVASTFDADRYDVGDKLGFIRANVEYALKSKEIGADMKEYIKELAKTL